MLLYTFSVKDWNWSPLTEEYAFLEGLALGGK